MPKEIERRFVLERLPVDFELHHPHEIHQAYTLIDDEAGFEERVRYRCTPDGDRSYIHYRKHGRGRDRIEIPTPISVDEFRQGLTSCIGLPIIKHVYFEQFGGRWIELHVFRSHQPFMTIEVEFNDEADAVQFVPFEWFGREVTADRRYNSAGIARFGIPNNFHPNDELVRRFYGSPTTAEGSAPATRDAAR